MATSRRTFLTTAAALTGAATLGTAGPAAAAHPARHPLLPPGDWILDPALSDEFAGDAIDLDRWRTDHWNPVAHDVGFNPANVRVSGGMLHLWLTADPYAGGQYSGGNVRSRFFIPGDTYTEVRARQITHKANANSAIWLLEGPSTAERNPNVELDMFEYLAPMEHPNRLHHSIHLWPVDPDGTKEHVAVAHIDDDGYPHDLDRGFHRYGMERRDGKVTFFMDGRPHWTYDAAEYPDIATQPQPMIFYVRGIPSPVVAEELPAEFTVDYLRVYRAA